jgi:hypothetical protein
MAGAVASSIIPLIYAGFDLFDFGYCLSVRTKIVCLSIPVPTCFLMNAFMPRESVRPRVPFCRCFCAILFKFT